MQPMKFGAVIAFTVRGSEGPNEKWGVREGRSSVPVGDLESLHRREV